MPRTIAAGLLVLANILAYTATSEHGPGVPALGRFPNTLAEWRCRETAGRDYSDPSADQAWSARCETGDDYPIGLYVGYAGHQTHGKRLRSPRVHYPDGAAGWSDAWSRRIDIPVVQSAHGSADLPAREVLLRHIDGRWMAVLYWYEIGGSAVADEYAYRLAFMVRAVTQGRFDAAVVRIAAPVTPGRSGRCARAAGRCSVGPDRRKPPAKTSSPAGTTTSNT